MGDKATTLDKQISILQDERKMIIEDEKKCKEILADIGYYRLGFYWFHFEVPRTQKDDPHIFKPGTCFSDVVKLYYLDVDLRHLLLKYLHRIEVHYRTKIIYLGSNKYTEKPTWFSDSRYIKPNFIAELPKTYTEKFKRYNTVIRKHHEKYKKHKYAPAWKSLEFFPFGAINSLYKNMKDCELKKKIANVYGYVNPKLFSENMTAIVNLRNVCSHGGTLIDYSQIFSIRKLDTDIYKCDDKHSLNASITLMLNMLSKISMSRAIELERRVKQLFNVYRCNIEIRNIVENKAKYKIRK